MCDDLRSVARFFTLLSVCERSCEMKTPSHMFDVFSGSSHKHFCLCQPGGALLPALKTDARVKKHLISCLKGQGFCFFPSPPTTAPESSSTLASPAFYPLTGRVKSPVTCLFCGSFVRNKQAENRDENSTVLLLSSV